MQQSDESPGRPPPAPNAHPYAQILRQRASGLVDLARSIERSGVVSLSDRATSWPGRRAELALAMLCNNVQQLHRAADDLRMIAFRFRQRADELDLAGRTAA